MIRVERFLTLTQPWATLMAIGAKKIETRSWLTHLREQFAIHAAKGFPRDCQALCYREPFASALASAGYDNHYELPLGEVLAIARLADCKDTQSLLPLLGEPEISFGDYSPGRFGFVTEGVRRLRAPMPLRGLQRFQRLPAPILEADLLPS